jgi:DNA repair protein RadC
MGTTAVSEIMVSYKPAKGRRPIIKSSQDAYKELKAFFNEDTLALQEQFVVMYLNRGARLLGVFPISQGGITGTIADCRLILGTALKMAATGIILCHNHPSGNLQPSESDKQLTNKIAAGAKLLDMEVFDHLIISAEGEYLSLAEEGII